MKYDIQAKEIDIQTDENVFLPSLHGSSALGSCIKVLPDETVIDVGTGTGLLAILAAKLGGRVTAVDILPEAVALTKENVKLNEVFVDVQTSDLFASVTGQVFDVIIANIPQENISPKIIDSLTDQKVIGMHGGKNGNELLLRVLGEAHTYMHKTSRLYVVAYTMSDFRVSLKVIVGKYNAKLLNYYTGPVKDFVYQDITWYEQQSYNGIVEIYKKQDKYYADLFVFELTLKS